VNQDTPLALCLQSRRGGDVCRLRCGAMVTKVLTTIVWASVLVLGLLFVVFATPLIFLIDND